MKKRSSALGILLILGALAISGCGTAITQPTQVPPLLIPPCQLLFRSMSF
jgi:hypothetical protein